METLHNEQKKRIRYMYTWMFRRYKKNVIADSVSSSVRNDTITTGYLKMAQNNRMDKSIRFGWLGEAGSKIESGKVSKLYDINCFEQLGSELITNGDFSTSSAWVLELGFSITNNTLVGGNATGAAVKILGGTPPLTNYKITYTIVSITQGSVRAIRGSHLGIVRTTPGTYTEYIGITATAGQDGTGVYGTNFSGVIDNITVKQVLNSTNQNNATQTTPTSRPYLTGNIAPNEKLGLKNPNGGNNFMTHPTISFAANESWSVTTVLKPFGFATTQTFIIGGTNTKVRFTTLGKLEIVNESNTTVTGTFLYHKYVGKNTCIHLVAAGNGTIIVYANTVPVETITIASNLSFTQENTISSPFYGCLYGDLRRAQALTPTQVTAEYDYLRSVYPEIESVVIGTQAWATSNCEMAATPMGNVIANVTDNTIWASSQTLYDNAWNAAGGAGGGTAAIYAGVKAAAMWCHYNNSVDNGAIYGKLYNWFAVKLLQMDIDYYNTANPTALWGWRVPTQADWNIAATLISAPIGSNIKAVGTAGFDLNTDATNTTGLSIIGSGQRDINGVFGNLRQNGNIQFIDGCIWVSWGATGVYTAILNNKIGYPIRLIKSA